VPIAAVLVDFIAAYLRFTTNRNGSTLPVRGHPHLFFWGVDVAGSNSVTPTNFSCGLFRAQTKALDHHVSHDELLNFARDGHRELLDKFDVARNFVVCDLFLAESLDLVGGRGHAGA
jgi:hypothetical protein